jgi:shikimate dehydrogenase
VIHRAAYLALGLDAEFTAHDVPPDRLAATLAELRARGLTQLCVSLPHKEAVLALADRVSSDARAIGAANTLTERDGTLVADNTDWIGVTNTVEPLGDWRGRRATVLGAGGAARAVVYALLQLSMTVTVVNRTRSRADRLVADLGGGVGSLDEPYDLLVNATSLGMSPDVDSTPVEAAQLRGGATVFDTVYRPLETRLLREARAAGCRVQDGLDMLVHQAVEQIRLWSGERADAALLRRVALEELARR